MGKFVTKKGNDGQYYFNLKADNGQIILSSEGYSSSSARENGIESVKTNAPNGDHYDRKTSSNGKYYFNLKAVNGQIIGKSELYESSSSRDNGIESVKKNAPDATIVEE
ncbi:YegP family protein [Solitalea sp. MAHUQ-68]|uniref:YegP family protein n=1 Tax=Solitalea agri TaxID=2953739 RepID=A0A9X2F1Q7_9SPHI|nr:YegP family protein [Solitalea agri]MCO4292596.1 YegP family protein [Solitalea agri]